MHCLLHRHAVTGAYLYKQASGHQGLVTVSQNNFPIFLLNLLHISGAENIINLWWQFFLFCFKK